MADGKRDIELIIRAKDLGSKTFKDVSTAVDGVTASIDKQVTAAKKGEVSAAELRDTMRQLEQAGAALIKQQGLVDLYAKLEQQLKDTEQQAADLRQQFTTLNNSGGIEGLTKKQVVELQRLEKALDAAGRKVETTQASMAVQGQKLEAAGLATNNLAAAQQNIAQTAQKVGAALTVVDGALTNYNATLREVKTEQAAVNAEVSKAAASASFRKLGDDALLSAANLDKLVQSETKTAGESSALARSLAAILDPSAAAVTTLGGLEERTTSVAAEIGDAQKPIYAYTNAINELARVQGAILGQAKDIDAYRNQKRAVDQATAAYDHARQKVIQLATAVRDAKEPDDALAASLRMAQAELTSAGAAVDANKAKLDRLAGSLTKAEIDTNDLASGEKRLTAASNIAAAASQKLASAQAGTNSKTGRFLGLRPYELQNLSYQVNDVFTQLASGTRPMQVLAQQGGQFAQIFPQAIGALLRFAPAILAVVAVLGTLFAAFKRIYDLEGAGRKFSAMLAASADGARYNAKALAENARALEDLGVKLADAEKAVTSFVQSGLDPSMIDAFGKAARDMAKVTGTDVPTAAGRLAGAFHTGYDAVAKLDDEFNFLTAAERLHIKAMFDSGNAAGARTEAFRIFAREMDDAAKKAQGPWSDAARSMGHAWKSFLDAIGNTGIIQGTIAELENLAKIADHVASSLPGASKPGAALTGGAAAGNGGLPGGVQRQGVGLLSLGLAGAIGGPGGVASALSAPRAIVVTPEIDAIVRTVIKEARAANAQGQQDVAAVILNRMAASGMSGDQVVKAPGQFQPWGTAAGVKALESIDQNSKEYRDALQNILPILEGRVTDPTKGAVNFYSPAGQRANVAQGLSRNLVPGFAQPNALTVARNGQEFFGGTFPGDKRGGATGASQQALKAGQDYVIQLQEQFALENKVSDAERVRLAGVQALREAQSRGADAASAQTAKSLAEAEEQHKVDIERAAQRQQLLQQLVSSGQQAAAGQDADLQSRLDAVTNKFKVIYAQIATAREKGLTDIDGKSLAAFEQMIKANEEILKQQETMKFYEQQLADLERQRAEAIKAIQSQQAAGELSPQAAATAVQDVNAKLLPQMQALADQAVRFAQGIKTATPDPKLAAFIAQMQGASANAVGAGAKESLQFYEDAAAKLQKQQADALNNINQLAAQGTLGATEAFNQAQGVVATLGPQMADLAQNAITFAEGVGGANPSPQMQAFISSMKLLQTQSGQTRSTRSAANVVGNAQAAEEERKLNEILSQRSQLLELIQTQEQQGQITHAQAQERIDAAYQKFAPLIDAEIAKISELIKAMHDAGVISDQVFDAWNAKLATVHAQTTHVSESITQLRETITNSFVTGVVDAFDTITGAIGAAIAGTGSWKDALRSLGSAALTFAAQFLKSMGDMLIQMLALKAIQTLLGFTPLGPAAAVLPALHGGGRVGAVGVGVRRSINPAIFLGAPRYHTGQTSVGLAHDEQAAILKRGEEVLASNDSRNMANIAKTTGARSGGFKQRIIAVLDEKDIHAAMASSAGEEITIAHIKKNRATVGQLVGSGSRSVR